jgi:type I restriction enzyme S subunit
MKENDGELYRLEDISDLFVPSRFKRMYVENEEIGIPLLQGSHIPMIKPLGIKCVWEHMDAIKSYIIHKNWILITCSGTIGKLSLVSDYWDDIAATNHLLRAIPDETTIHPGYLTVFLQSIYGQIQLDRLTYGGVVDEIGEAGELFNDILIYKPDDVELEKKIGSMVVDAYNMRDKATQIEEEAFEMLENQFTKLADKEI